jgi:peptidoglycan-N-acetylglucosamine deacetylase
VSTDSRPVGRRLLLTFGAAALLGGCAEPAVGRLTAIPRPEPTAPWPVPTPTRPTAGACPTAPGIVDKADGPQHYVPCAGTNIALTIDDGPDPRWTPQVLGLLATYQISATFCMIGRSAKAHPDLVAAVADAGHQIANHTFNHPTPLGRLATPRIHTEIDQTSDVIASATGKRPQLFRAPGGEWSPAVLAACTGAGMRPLDWSVDPRDWSLPGTQHIVEVILTKTEPGSIILEHDGDGGGSVSRAQTVDALRLALPRLLNAGYTFTLP